MKKKLAISDELQLPFDSLDGAPGAIWQKYAFPGAGAHHGLARRDEAF
jgi:hypothetical protein